MKALPLKLVIQIDCTNFSTMRDAVEKVAPLLGTRRFPKKGQTLKDIRFEKPYWRVKVLDCVTSLEVPKRPKVSRKVKKGRRVGSRKWANFKGPSY